MDALGIERADLYGSHTGAHIVLEMALAQPQRFGRVVLDGIPVFSASDKADLLAHYAPAIKPDERGASVAASVDLAPSPLASTSGSAPLVTAASGFLAFLAWFCNAAS